MDKVVVEDGKHPSVLNIYHRPQQHFQFNVAQEKKKWAEKEIDIEIPFQPGSVRQVVFNELAMSCCSYTLYPFYRIIRVDILRLACAGPPDKKGKNSLKVIARLFQHMSRQLRSTSLISIAGIIFVSNI